MVCSSIGHAATSSGVRGDRVMEIIIETNGAVRCLYGEALDLHAIGQPLIKRGSHVEPTTDGKWTADMAPVDGPVLGPFRCRSNALNAERAWLETNWLVPIEHS